MANHKSSEKRIRQTVLRTQRGRMHVGAMRTAIKKVEQAVASGNKEAARDAFKDAQPFLMRQAQRGLLHARTASRKISRLAAKIKSL